VTPEAEDLRRDVLALPVDERANLAAELLASLDPDADDPATVRTDWAEELERRARRVLSGEADGEDWERIRQRLADKISG
jgi:putative addiction module component (TIGR02574 family)